MKIHIGNDSIEFYMPDSTIVCAFERAGITTKIACDSISELIVEFNKSVFLRFRREKNQVVVYIRADRHIKVLTEAALRKNAVDIG